MKNLMTRKCVFGVLMACVLALGVQGIAEALTFDASAANLPEDLSNQNIGTQITLGANLGGVFTLDKDSAIESVNISVSGGGANFVVGNTPKTSHTFTETGINGTLTAPALTIAIRSYGKVTLKIRDTSSVPTAERAADIVRTYYAVRITGTPQTASIRLAGISNGIKEGYFGIGSELIYGGDSSHYAVTYTISDGSTAELVEGSGANERTADYESNTTTSSAAKIRLKERAGTATVKAQVAGARSEYASVGVYVFKYAKLVSPVSVSDAASNGNAALGQEITGAFTATVQDGASTPAGINGVPVKFEVKDKSISGGMLLPGDATIVDASNRQITNSKPAKALYVRTASAGQAVIGYRMGTAGRNQAVVVSAVGDTEEVKAVSNAAASRELSIYANQKQSGFKKYDLVMLVEDDGKAVSGVTVRFNTLKGTLQNTPRDGSNPTTNATQVDDVTDPQGHAQVVYDPGDSTGTLEIIVRVAKTGNEIGSNDAARILRTINVGSGGVAPPNQNQQQGTGRDYLSFNLGNAISGYPGDAINLEARAINRDGQRQSGITVAFRLSETTSGSLSHSSRTTNSNGVAQTTLTLPGDDAVVTATASGYETTQANITILARASDLAVVSGNNQTGTPGSTLSSAFVVRFEDSDDQPVVGAVVSFAVESGGGSVSASTDTTDSSGEAETTLTLGNVGMQNTVRASVSSSDYPNVSSITFTATAEDPAEAVIVAGGDDQTGQVNRRLDQDLSAQVVDRRNDGVAGILVRFRVTEGRGRLSRTSVRTDEDGYADVGFTPTADGEAEVEAYSTGLDSAFFTITTGEPPANIVSISGNNQSGKPGATLAKPFVVEVTDANKDPVSGVTVTFSVTGGGGSVSPGSVNTNANGRAQTTLTLGPGTVNNWVVASVSGVSTRITFRASPAAQVLVDASQRPPLYWSSRTQGQLHRLVGAAVENLAPNVRGVTSLAIDTQNSLLYFGVKTGEETGAIRRSNLNGSNVQTVINFPAVPKDIALDSNGSTLYLVTAGGQLQQVNTQGAARLMTIRQNLPALSAIAVSNGYVYWAEMLGRLRRLNLTAERAAIQDLVTGLDEPISLSVSKGKVYWMQRNAEGGGRLQHANLDGTGVQSLKYFASGLPLGFTVNTSENKIYWTLDDGKIQQANIWGQSARDLVAGLLNPGVIAVGPAVAETPVVSQPTQPTQPMQPTTQQPTTYSRYDINKDGKINNADTRAVAGAIGQSGAAITNPRTDVDSSGTVDVTDIILVLANLDDDVAAPAIDVDFKALAVDFDRLQEQVEMLLASGDRFVPAQRALLYLQHLLASARPDETVLLANYPNPFNPETWIPYHLAQSTAVQINIYDAQGTLIRVLSVGHQSAGYYTSRSRAAYWDGRNALGERVASGIYFYQLQTDALSPLRKMVIVK